MEVLVSFRRVRPPCCAGLGVLHPDTGKFRIVLEFPKKSLRCDGFGGMAVGDNALFVATEPFRHRDEAEPSLLCFRSKDLMLEERYQLRGMGSIRTLWFWESTLYVASGATGEIHAFRTDGSQVLEDRFVIRHWLNTEGQAELYHTALQGLQNDLYATAIDQRTQDGLLLNVTRDAVVARGLSDPQSLALDGDALVYADSSFGAVHRLNRSFTPYCSAPIGGLARGLAVTDSGLFAGSTTEEGCTIIRLEPGDLRITDTFPTSVSGAEIGTLLPIEGAGAWPPPDQSFWDESYPDWL